MALVAVYLVLRPDIAFGILLELQLAGTAEHVVAVVGSDYALYRREMMLDYLLIFGYGILLLLLCRMGSWLFVSNRGRGIAQAGMGASVIAVVADSVENGILLYGIRDDRIVEDDRVFEWVQGAATAKWAMLVIAVSVSIAVIMVAVKRLVASQLRACLGDKTEASLANEALQQNEAPKQDLYFSPAPVVTSGARFPSKKLPSTRDGRASRWAHAQSPLPLGRNERPAGGVGFCVSGGGIRSAAFTLGALDSLRDKLRNADYLVSVSGGGYAAGALRLALQEFETNKPSAATAADVFGPGSVELDHLRRNGHYIADGAREWVAALGVLLRGVLVSLGLITAVVCTLGLLVNLLHASLPFFDLPINGQGPFLPRGVRDPRIILIIGAVVSAGVLWLLAVLLQVSKGRNWNRAARGLVAFAAVVATFVIAVPGLAHVALWRLPPVEEAESFAPLAALTVIGTYGGALIAVLWKQREHAGKLLGRLRKKEESSELTRAVPNGFVQYVIVWFVLILIAAVFLFLFAWSAATARDWATWVKLALPAGLILVGAGFDHTRLSLHPFYRRRLAGAFSVRRRELDDYDVVAEPYDFSERTDLETYGSKVDEFPRLIFAAAANLSGSDRAPPKRRAVSYTFSNDYIGGPDVGYICTSTLGRRMPDRLKRDLTVQTAVAVSGAAFASAMGRQARAFQTLLAISNARLGTWLPNPAYLAETLEARWHVPGVPTQRRLTYQLKEIFGLFAHDDPLLLITDGGHYENLGLVELLRHGPATVYCIDGSGDNPPFATTLAEAIALAYEELGVRIELANCSLEMVPGSAEPLEPPEPLATLNARLSKRAVTTGRILYPEHRRKGTPAEGRLIVAKAGLTPDMPYELLSYAMSKPAFPRDSTGDQWFDHDQFTAYHSLGQFIGAQAKAVRHRMG